MFLSYAAAVFQVELSGIGEIYQNRLFTDLTLHVCLGQNSQVFPVHRIILAAVSPYFRRLFKEWNISIISLTDTHPEAFAIILDLIYCGETKRVVSKELLLTVIELMCRFELNNIEKLVEDANIF
jgi:hypothetical protein